MVVDDRVLDVMSALQRAGREKTTLSFGGLHALFGEAPELNDVYDTLERASGNLADLKDAIPSALLAKRSDGLPGNGFFEIFKLHRSADYNNIAGAQTPVPMLTQTQKEQMTTMERSRVYAYAIANSW